MFVFVIENILFLLTDNEGSFNSIYSWSSDEYEIPLNVFIEYHNKTRHHSIKYEIAQWNERLIKEKDELTWSWF